MRIDGSYRLPIAVALLTPIPFLYRHYYFIPPLAITSAYLLHSSSYLPIDPPPPASPIAFAQLQHDALPASSEEVFDWCEEHALVHEYRGVRYTNEFLADAPRQSNVYIQEPSCCCRSYRKLKKKAPSDYIDALLRLHDDVGKVTEVLRLMQQGAFFVATTKLYEAFSGENLQGENRRLHLVYYDSSADHFVLDLHYVWPISYSEKKEILGYQHTHTRYAFGPHQATLTVHPATPSFSGFRLP